MQIAKTVRDLVNTMDTVPANTANRLCPTVDTFICTHTAAASAAPPTQHSHFTVRDNYHEIEALLLEGRPGDACLPSIISRAAEGSGYAALFSGEFYLSKPETCFPNYPSALSRMLSAARLNKCAELWEVARLSPSLRPEAHAGQHTVTAAPQVRQTKVASASMFAKSTASHPKPHSSGHRHASGGQQGLSQHPNKCAATTDWFSSTFPIGSALGTFAILLLQPASSGCVIGQADNSTGCLLLIVFVIRIADGTSRKAHHANLPL